MIIYDIIYIVIDYHIYLNEFKKPIFSPVFRDVFSYLFADVTLAPLFVDNRLSEKVI